MASAYISSRYAERISTVLVQHPDIDLGVQKIGEDTEPDVLAKSGVILIGRKPEFAERESLAGYLAGDQRYHKHLINARLLSSEECLVAAAALCQADTAFVAGLIRAADDA